MNRRWFGGKARVVQSVEIADIVPFCPNTIRSYFVLTHVRYASGSPETYNIPLLHVSGESESGLRLRPLNSAEDIVLDDALSDEHFLICLLDAIRQNLSFRGSHGAMRAVSTKMLNSLLGTPPGLLTPSLMKAEQSNSSVAYDQRLVLKIFRRLEDGLNPDLEISSFLTEKSAFKNIPPLAGYLEYVSDGKRRSSLGMLQGYIANQGDAWQFTLKALAEYYGNARQGGHLTAGEIPRDTVLNLAGQVVPKDARRRIGPYLDSAAVLGRRTAELHIALASASEDPDFAPQPFSAAARQALINSAVQLLASNFDLLRRRKQGMAERVRQDADKVFELEVNARQRFQLLGKVASSVMQTRIHGDYHLGQVLCTDGDFVIIDFEGEPARSLEERRKKRSPLQDVAGMLRSFHYVAYAPLLQQASAEGTPEEGSGALDSWACYWQKWVSAAFLKNYLEVSGSSIFIPGSSEELALLLDFYTLDKAVYELGYELNNRPSWVRIPLDGIAQLLGVR